MRKEIGLQSWLLLGVLSIIWGSSFILIKKGLIAFNYWQVGALRILLSALIAIPFSFSNWKHVNSKNWLPILGTGIFGSGIPPFLFALAQTQISSSMASMLNVLTPLFTFLLGVIVFGVAFQKNKLFGVFIGLLGAFLILAFGKSDTQNGINIYGLLVVAATLCYGMSVNIIKKYLNETPSLAITAFSFLFICIPASILFFFINPIETYKTQTYFWQSLGFIAILAFVGTAFANFLFFKLTQKTSAVFASTVTYTIPIVALFWGVLDGENVQLIHIAGMILILIGVWITGKVKN